MDSEFGRVQSETSQIFAVNLIVRYLSEFRAAFLLSAMPVDSDCRVLVLGHSHVYRLASFVQSIAFSR